MVRLSGGKDLTRPIAGEGVLRLEKDKSTGDQVEEGKKGAQPQPMETLDKINCLLFV